MIGDMTRINPRTLLCQLDILSWSLLPNFYSQENYYNAALSVYERLIISEAPRLSVKAVYYWLLDFVAVFTSVETNSRRTI